MPDRADPTDPSYCQIWTEGFRHGYAGFVIRQTGGDRSYEAGYAAGQELRQAHREDYERALFDGAACGPWRPRYDRGDVDHFCFLHLSVPAPPPKPCAGVPAG